MPVAVVTGASGGLGREITLKFLEQGYTTIALFHRADEGEVGEYFGAFRDRLTVLRMDVRDSEEVARVFALISELFGRLDCLVHSAGITRDGLLVKCREEDWDEVMAVNLTGSFHVIQNAIPLLMRSGGGHILIVSSRSGLKGKAGQAAYSASKAALIGLTATLARELAPHQIRVNVLMPGYMDTPMGRANRSALQKAKEESCLHCLSKPEEAADMVAAMVRSTGITGQVFTLDSRV